MLSSYFVLLAVAAAAVAAPAPDAERRTDVHHEPEWHLPEWHKPDWHKPDFKDIKHEIKDKIDDKLKDWKHHKRTYEVEHYGHDGYNEHGRDRWGYYYPKHYNYDYDYDYYDWDHKRPYYKYEHEYKEKAKKIKEGAYKKVDDIVGKVLGH